MATESPVRMVESSRGGEWPSTKDTATFGSPLRSMAAEELGLLMKGHGLHRDQSDLIPNRSGSAPPSIEGSFAAIRNLLNQQNVNVNQNFASLTNTLKNFESEEQLRSDPGYLAYYCSNVHLNPRLPPPLASLENRHLLHRIAGSGNNYRLTSQDDSGNGSLHLFRGSLSTHKEESEEDSSSKQASDNLEENDSALFTGKNMASLASRHKSLVDLIQEDFPRTPSPVYNLSCSSSHATTDELVDNDMNATMNISSIDMSKVPESNAGSVDVCPEKSALDMHAIRLIPSDASFTTYPDETGSPLKDESKDKAPNVENNASVSGTLRLDVTRMEPRKKGTNMEITKNQQEEQQSYGRNAPKLHLSTQQGLQYQVQGVQAQVISQGMNHLESGMESLTLGHPKFSSVDVQPPLHSPGFTPPFYATAAAYTTSGNPFYPNFQPSGLYVPQYGLTGYALGSTLLPPFMAGYPSHGALPLPFDATSSPSFNGRTAGLSTGEGIPHLGDMQHQSKFYEQHGSMMQTSYVNPLHMQYYPRPLQDAYGASVQHSQFASRGVIGGQFSQESTFATYMGDQKFQSPTNGSLSIPSPRKVGGYGNPPVMGVMQQFPASPLASPVMPSSPVGRTNHPGHQNEMRFSQGSIRSTGVYSGWSGQRGFNSVDDTKRRSFLEALKSSNAQKFELSDIEGRIVEFSVDQHGSRFIQQKLEHCSAEEKASVFREVLPHVSKLMTDVFGNYVIQKFFEHGSSEQRKELANQLSGHMLPLSLQMYGCRVIQKALEVIELDQKTQLVRELDGHVMKCVRDQNGNHVIQKCIECVPVEKIGFIISAFEGQVKTLSTHPYGCRVIQRVLEHCADELRCQCIVDEILESTCDLAQDQYGNYVTQHVLERGKPNERSQIIGKLTGRIVQMSQHKYASNVVEKCLEHGNPTERDLLIEEILGQSEENDSLLTMMKDQFANYVVQKILETSNDKQREVLLNCIKVNIQALKKYTYGKHIVARFEQLSGEESQTSEPEGA
uniref:pumilio homolog 5 n=1 Tax=Ziziphus jujuba TaxID=326968 RepID=A0A6P4AFH2_ZIZJJ